MRITLTVTEGPHQGQAFVFDGHDTFLVGRSSCAHFRLPSKDRYFSRIHFLVEVNPPHCRLMDMSSSNGTYVNGRRVERTDLRDGDTIRAGQTVLQVAVTAAAVTPALALSPDPGAVRRPAPAAGAARQVRGLRRPADESQRRRPVPGLPGRSRTMRQTVAGYQIIRELGRGAMGLVYLAVRRTDSRPVALKTIIPAAGGTEAQILRFLREADILRELEHPHIVAFRDMGESSGHALFRHGVRPRPGRLPAAQKARAVRRARAAGLIGPAARRPGLRPRPRLRPPRRQAVQPARRGPGRRRRAAHGGRLRPGQGLPGVEPERPDDDRRRGRHHTVHGAGADHRSTARPGRRWTSTRRRRRCTIC